MDSSPSVADLTGLVLGVLADMPRHGYAIAREIERRNGEGVLKAGQGKLYPVLRALEADGFVVSSWETPPSGPARRIYTLTEKGGGALARREAAAPPPGRVRAAGNALAGGTTT